LSTVHIRTERILLRDFQLSDFDELHAFASDPEVTRFTSFGPNQPDETRTFLESAIAEAAAWPRREYWLAAELIDGGAMIGSCGVGKETHAQWELGYVLSRQHWGRGIATEIVRALTQFSFSQLDAKKVWAPVDARNVASCRVLEKAGFTLEGLLRQDRLKWPEGRDTKMYGLLESEFLSGKHRAA